MQPVLPANVDCDRLGARLRTVAIHSDQDNMT